MAISSGGESAVCLDSCAKEIREWRKICQVRDHLWRQDALIETGTYGKDGSESQQVKVNGEEQQWCPMNRRCGQEGETRGERGSECEDSTWTQWALAALLHCEMWVRCFSCLGEGGLNRKSEILINSLGSLGCHLIDDSASVLVF